MDFKSFKEMLKKIFLALFMVAVIACKAKSRVDTAVDSTHNLKPEAQQNLVASELVKIIESANFKKVKLNDSISSVIFDRYLKQLDEGHNYLLASDVKEFEEYRYSLDDDLREGDLSAMFRMFNVLQKRYEERLRYSLAQVNKPFDFTKNETYTYNREKLPWFKSSQEADEVWTKRVKYDLLNLRLSGTDAAKNAGLLKQRYENLLSQTKKLNNQDAFQVMMDAFTESIDPHTNYFNPENAQRFNEEMARTFEGIGASLQLENEVVKIAGVIPGGPAFKSKKINVNDKIIAVAQGADGEFVDVRGWRLDNTVQKIKGPRGTVVRLKIIPAGQELSAQPKIVSLVREKVVLEDQSAKKKIKTVTSGGKTYKIGIIEVPAFYMDFKAYQAGDPNYKSTTRDVKLIIDTLKRAQVDGIVMDLRTNGGGSLMEAIELTGLFIKTGPVVQVRDPRRTEINADDDPSIIWTGPLGVMVDRFSASASEIFAAAIQDYNRGVIMGTQTYGKGTVQSALDLSRFISTVDELLNKFKGSDKEGTSATAGPKYGQINLTMAKFYRINGSSTQHKGVIPDIQFPMIFPADKYGESSEPSALPFDSIKPSKYAPVANLQPIKPMLVKQHEERMKASPDYKYLLEDIEQFKKRESEASVTLNEAQLKKEREEQEAKTLARDNKRRALQGLPPLKKGEVKPKEENDFVQDESLKIMADFIRFNKAGQFTMVY
ncbi:tail-specific protease [Arcticibacter tournemirensis]|uniref:Tail-specific protease n=2 Tax=Arcticibacter tournemirensis TaxID=699437 RepID=A0A5M9HJQ6_9SPHI|nr:carboxy terminal-processing peptidase [Arcticibacter tournemirensis]KAA8485608.1 tail-specific protease [Arcticibacter tournemirensis]